MAWLNGGKPRGRNAGKATREKYSHHSAATCRQCGHFLDAVGTRHDGAKKRWKCPRCGRTAESAGITPPTL